MGKSLKTYNYGSSYLKRTDDSSTAMNIDGATDGGQDQIIWNGDGSYWTLAGQGSSTTASKKNGTNGFDSSTQTNTSTTFDKGSNISVHTLYDVLRFWHQPKKFLTNSELRLSWWKTGGSSQVGNYVEISDYTHLLETDEWREFEIPIEDFTLDGTVGRLKLDYYSAAPAKSQQHWLDDIALDDGGGGDHYIFRLTPPANTLYHVECVSLILADGSSSWNDSDFGEISTASQGVIIRFRNKTTGEVHWSHTLYNNTDLLCITDNVQEITFPDTTKMVVVTFETSLFCGHSPVTTLDSDNVLEAVVRDDLTGLTALKCFARYSVEK